MLSFTISLEIVSSIIITLSSLLKLVQNLSLKFETIFFNKSFSSTLTHHVALFGSNSHQSSDNEILAFEVILLFLYESKSTESRISCHIESSLVVHSLAIFLINICQFSSKMQF